jgi:hypothetical protein
MWDYGTTYDSCHRWHRGRQRRCCWGLDLGEIVTQLLGGACNCAIVAAIVDLIKSKMA